MKTKHRIQKIISLILSLAFLVGLFPMSALAAGARGETPEALTFKVMYMEGVNHTPVSQYEYANKDNDFTSLTKGWIFFTSPQRVC